MLHSVRFTHTVSPPFWDSDKMPVGGRRMRRYAIESIDLRLIRIPAGIRCVVCMLRLTNLIVDWCYLSNSSMLLHTCSGILRWQWWNVQVLFWVVDTTQNAFMASGIFHTKITISIFYFITKSSTVFLPYWRSNVWNPMHCTVLRIFFPVLLICFNRLRPHSKRKYSDLYGFNAINAVAAECTVADGCNRIAQCISLRQF